MEKVFPQEKLLSLKLPTLPLKREASETIRECLFVAFIPWQTQPKTQEKTQPNLSNRYTQKKNPHENLTKQIQCPLWKTHALLDCFFLKKTQVARQQALLPREGATRLHVSQGLVLPPEQPEARFRGRGDEARSLCFLMFLIHVDTAYVL